MIPFILPNLYYRLHSLPKKELDTDSNYYDWMTDIWLHVEPAYEAFYAWARQRCNGTISDLGCGDGNVGKKIGASYFYDYVQSFPECLPLDLTSPIDSPLNGNTFILSHVLEHLPNPKDSLRYLFNALKSGDRLIISVPDGSKVDSTAIPFNQYIPSNDMTGKHQHHIYAWTAADLYNTLISQGWDGIDIATADVCGFACIWALAAKP
jgi:SAM-dependent methyltransferase